MTQGKLGAFLLGLSLAGAYVLGCATARVIEPTAAAQYAPPGVPRWQYVCTEGRNVETTMARSNELGAMGWEMVAAALDRGIWCFKRPL